MKRPLKNQETGEKTSKLQEKEKLAGFQERTQNFDEDD